MEELIDLIASDGSASDVSNAIKQILYTKAADRIDAARPEIATAMFDSEDAE